MKKVKFVVREFASKPCTNNSHSCGGGRIDVLN